MKLGKEIGTDTEHQTYSQTCIMSEASYAISNIGIIDYNVGIKSYTANSSVNTIYNSNSATINMGGGRIYYNNTNCRGINNLNGTQNNIGNWDCQPENSKIEFDPLKATFPYQMYSYRRS